MSRHIYQLFLGLCFIAIGQFAQAQESQQLEPNKPIEREIAGGQEHIYQISLTAGQFVRFRLEQRVIDAALTLSAPGGKRLVEMNLTSGGEKESLSLEAVLAGNYLLTVRGNGAATLRGSYHLETIVQATATVQDRKHLSAQALLVEAQELMKQAPNTAPQVIEKLEQALPIWRELGAPLWVALTLNKIGRAQMSQNQNEKAIPYFEQSLTINRELKNRPGEGVVLNNLANAYFNLRQFDKAIEIFEKTLMLYREIKDRRWEGLIIYALGNTQNRLNQPEKAIANFEQGLAILREVKDRAFEAQALLSLGNVYLNQGQSEKAIETTESAVTIFRELKDRSGEGRSLNNLAIIYSRIGQSEKAIKALEPALIIFRELKNRGQEVYTLNTLGLVYGGMGQTEKAIAYFGQVLGISRELKDKSQEAYALSNLGLAYSFLNQYDKAIEYLELALPITREIKSRQQEGSTYSSLGVAYAGLSRFEKAIESHEQALAIHREVKYRLGEGNDLENLGNVYKLVGRDDKAIEYYDQALVVFRETKYRVGEGNILANLGGSYNRLSRYEEAIRANEQALAIFRELKYRLGEASSLIELGVVNARLNQHKKALELYQQALPIFREVKSREFEGLTLFRMGESKQQMRRTDEAATLFTESATILREIGNKNLEFGALTALAKVERERGNLAKARTIVEESLQISESLRADLISPESRTIFLSGVQDSYQLYTDLLMQQHKAEPMKGFDALAVEVSERQRARSLLDLLTESGTDVRQGVDSALVERERTLAKQLNDKAQQLLKANKPEQSAALKQEISQLENDLERAQVAIRKSNPHYAALTQPQPLKLKEIQQQLDADTLLLEYSLGEERSYLWAISKDSLTSYELPKEEEIKKNALAVYELLTARNTKKSGETAVQRKSRIADAEAKLPAATRVLSDTLLAPAAAQLGSKQLVIVADGALQYIPFAMLPDPAVGNRSPVSGKNQPTASNLQPLIVGHEVVSLPSASALAIQRTELADRQPAPKTLAVIADPVFDKTDARFKTPTPETGDKAQPQTVAFADERSLEHIADESGEKGTRRLVIRRLRFTQREADGLLALAPKTSRFGATGFQANRATVLSGDLAQYRYVHFATHGLLDSERPGLSSLVLSMVDAQGRTENGFLRANDIYNMKLPAELVVLSACQTGLGKEVKGEGLIGLTRGFMYAGARRVVVSLWSVNDKATADLMEKFYRRMLKDNERPAAALRAAQIEMWKQKAWQSPYYWSAFVIQGEWR